MPEVVIAKFFRGECNEEEEQQVKLYFMEHPDELEKYMTEDSWHKTESYLLPGTASADMLKKIERATGRSAVVNMRRQWVAAAAILAVILGASWLWQQQPNQRSAISKSANKEPKQALTTRTNTTRKAITITTKDGSSITLEAGSSVAFYEPFRDNRRDFFVKGNALFNVAPDKKQPFTVFAGKVATTALGTIFRVRETAKGMVQVRLYSGKVMVNVAEDTSGAVYLKPGQELVCQHNGSMPVVKAFSEKRVTPTVAVNKEINASISFANESLKSIFEKLKKEKGVNIQYNDADIADMSFTGTFNPAIETLDSFIETIALLNGLSAKKEKNSYHINR